MVAAWLDTVADSPNTRRAYEADVREALAEIGVRHLGELTGAILAAWRARLLSRQLSPPPHRLSLASISRKLASLRSLLRFGARTGACPRLTREVIDLSLPLPRARPGGRVYPVLSDEELGRLLDAAGHLPAGLPARDRALVAVMASSALRRAEAAALDVADILATDGRRVLQVRRGKGGGARVAPLLPEVAELLDRYLAETGRAAGVDGGPLWLDAGGRLEEWRVRDIVGRAADLAGLGAAAVSPHALRHTAAVRLYRATRDVLAVSQLLGHSERGGLATTQRYLRRLTAAELGDSLPPLPGA